MSILVVPFVILERSVAESPTARLARVEAATGRLAWLGRDTQAGWLNLANQYESAGRMPAAIRAYRSLMDTLRRAGQLPSTELANHLAQLLVTYQRSDPHSVAEALRLASWTVRVDPNDLASLEILAEANAAAGRLDEAREVGARALERARAAGALDRAAAIEARLQRYGAPTGDGSS